MIRDFEMVRAAQTLAKNDRKRGLAAFNDLFRAGAAPAPPNGRYAGELLALDIAPGLTELSQRIASTWMPWKGKRFDAAHSCGDNVFTRDSLALAHLYWPLYRRYEDDGPTTYRAFAFSTRVAPGIADPDRLVLKLDYDRKENPGLTVRRVVDELVQLEGDLYLGKAHMRWWWGKWQLVAYFLLSPSSPSRGI